MNIYSLYKIDTGELTGARVGVSGDIDPGWLPDGCSAILGEWDHAIYRVDHATGQCVLREPPPPDWRMQQRQAASEAMTAVLAAEASQARPMREIVAAMLAGLPAPPEAAARFAAIGQEIEAARSRYADIMAAESLTALESILAV